MAQVSRDEIRNLLPGTSLLIIPATGVDLFVGRFVRTNPVVNDNKTYLYVTLTDINDPEVQRVFDVDDVFIFSKDGGE